ncbi:hypothetical protein Q6273_28820, partial [Klebsiella pneumoniae]
VRELSSELANPSKGNLYIAASPSLGMSVVPQSLAQTMGRRQHAAEIHRQRTGQRATGDARRDHPQWVLGGKRDCAFGDKAHA